MRIAIPTRAPNLKRNKTQRQPARWRAGARAETMVPRGLEPRTLRLLAVRSNQLSYETSDTAARAERNVRVDLPRDRIVGGQSPSKHDTVSERLRRWTRNPLGSARRGSNPLGVDFLRGHWIRARQRAHGTRAAPPPLSPSTLRARQRARCTRAAHPASPINDSCLFHTRKAWRNALVKVRSLKNVKM